MRIKVLSILFLAAAMYATPAYAGQDYTVTLTNGNTLTANSYRLEGRKVYLRYPVGEVAIPSSEVASVASGDGGVQLLQIKGELKPGPAGAQEAASAQTALSEPLPGGQGAVPPEADAAGNPVAGGSDGLTDSRYNRTAAISGAVSGAAPAGGGVNGVFGGIDTDYDPAADSLAEQLSTADDGQAEEITKKLTGLLESPDGAVDSTQQQ
jgi:hypothetical protein